MRLANLNIDGSEQAAIRTSSGYVLLETINRELARDWPTLLPLLLQSGRLADIKRGLFDTGRPDLVQRVPEVISGGELKLAPLLRHPPKIFGIGLNYAAHAADLSEKTPTGIPGSFMKPDTTIIGTGDAICIPLLSQRTTAEAELAVVIGQTCRDVPQKNWRDVVAGFTCVIDMTAEDILRQNPRYLTVSKSFDTFFSLGPELVTPDEIDDVSALRVSTVINGRVQAENTVSNMTFSPAFLVAFLSSVMTLMPGDIISTGTPGAAVVAHGDVVECHIDGFDPLVNPVRDLKQDA